MKFTSMGLSEDLINTMEAVLAMEGDYEEFFQKALKKFGVDSPADFKSDEEKKKFFDYVDKNYKGKDEEVEEGKVKPVKKFLKLGDCSYDKKKKVKEDNSQGMEDFVEYKYKSASLNKIKQDLKKLMKRESEFKDSQKYGKMLMKAMDNVTLVNDDGIPHMTPKFSKEIIAAYNGDTMFREDVASIIIKHDDNLAYALFGV